MTRAPDVTAAVQPPRLSVIIPTRNEERWIGETLRRVGECDVHEIIVVDAHSEDRTVEVARSLGARVIASARSRGGQLNSGAAIARGEALLFLHADTLLPRGYAQHVRDVLAMPGISGGAFRLRIDAPSASLRLIETVANLRSRLLQRPYGDQAIFVRAETLRRVGGFPDVPIMEDCGLVRRLRRVGRIAIAPASVVTSARRWLDRGIWRATLGNQLCLVGHRLGVRPVRIARWRG